MSVGLFENIHISSSIDRMIGQFIIIVQFNIGTVKYNGRIIGLRDANLFVSIVLARTQNMLYPLPTTLNIGRTRNIDWHTNGLNRKPK